MSLIEVVGAALMILGSLLVFYVLLTFGERPEQPASRPMEPAEQTHRKAA